MGLGSDMGDLTEAIITVSHETKDGWHTFMSEQVPGLFLTGRSEDLQAIYESIPGTIAALARADFGIDVVVSPTETFSSYLDSLAPTGSPPASHYSIKSHAA